MRKLIFLLCSLLILSACTEQPLVGGDVDENGCKGSAGYQYCPSTGECQRMWEDFCAEFPDQYRITNFATCVLAGNPIMESYPQQCRAGDIIYVEDLPGEPEKTYCTPNQRNAEICTMEYRPVCGDNGETYSNPCVACIPEAVTYWIEGEC